MQTTRRSRHRPRSVMRFLFCALAGLILVGCSNGKTVLGQFSPGKSAVIAEVKTIEPSNPVNLSGKLVEKCPVAGCWFYLEDSTGRIKVDTKVAGFVVLDVPLGKRVEVAGI